MRSSVAVIIDVLIIFLLVLYSSKRDNIARKCYYENIRVTQVVRVPSYTVLYCTVYDSILLYSISQ